MSQSIRLSLSVMTTPSVYSHLTITLWHRTRNPRKPHGWWEWGPLSLRAMSPHADRGNCLPPALLFCCHINSAERSCTSFLFCSQYELYIVCAEFVLGFTAWPKPDQLSMFWNALEPSLAFFFTANADLSLVGLLMAQLITGYKLCSDRQSTDRHCDS